MNWNDEQKARKEKLEQRIYNSIVQRKVDIQKVISQYESGMGEEHIKSIHRLDDRELKCILKRYATSEIENTRNNQRSAFDKYKFNIMGLPKYNQDNNHEKPLTIQEAIKLVEER